MRKLICLVWAVLVAALAIPTVAQKGSSDGSQYGHGADSIDCSKNMSLSREYSKNKEYTEAIKYWRLAFADCPRSSKNLYLDGVTIMKYMIAKTNDPKIQAAYIDTLLLVYDKRIENFGERGNVLGRKGVDLMRYRRDELPYVEQAYKMLRESVELEKNKSGEATLATLFSSGIILYRNNKLSAENLLADYTLIAGIADALLAKNPMTRTSSPSAAHSTKIWLRAAQLPATK